jgi:hypothetical protein
MVFHGQPMLTAFLVQHSGSCHGATRSVLDFVFTFFSTLQQGLFFYLSGVVIEK